MELQSAIHDPTLQRVRRETHHAHLANSHGISHAFRFHLFLSSCRRLRHHIPTRLAGCPAQENRYHHRQRRGGQVGKGSLPTRPCCSSKTCLVELEASTTCSYPTFSRCGKGRQAERTQTRPDWANLRWAWSWVGSMFVPSPPLNFVIKCLTINLI